ncbi:unnamed protein product [Amoebophrya sp. A120]|nr:unnamed protein product [Amoebophrya sp. A120]|eukprot:GSA120T00021780001.1
MVPPPVSSAGSMDERRSAIDDETDLLTGPRDIKDPIITSTAKRPDFPHHPYPSGEVSLSFTHEVSPAFSSSTPTAADANSSTSLSSSKPRGLLHVSLRNVRHADASKDLEAKRLFEVIDKNRTHLREWLPWLDFVRKFEDEFFFLDKTKSDGEAGRSFVQVIEVLVTASSAAADDDDVASFDVDVPAVATIAGLCGFNFIDHDRRIGYIGYWLSQDFERCGLMTKCVEQLVEYGRREFQLQHFDISCAVGNLKSQKVAGKLMGFQKLEGVKDVEKLYGVEHELVSFVKTVADTKPDYSAREARRDYHIRDVMQ